MSLIHFHIVLILSAILLAGGTGLWGLERFVNTQAAVELMTCVLSFGIGLLLSAYLIWFTRRVKTKF